MIRRKGWSPRESRRGPARYYPWPRPERGVREGTWHQAEALALRCCEGIDDRGGACPSEPRSACKCWAPGPECLAFDRWRRRRESARWMMCSPGHESMELLTAPLSQEMVEPHQPPALRRRGNVKSNRLAISAPVGFWVSNWRSASPWRERAVSQHAGEHDLAPVSRTPISGRSPARCRRLACGAGQRSLTRSTASDTQRTRSKSGTRGSRITPPSPSKAAAGTSAFGSCTTAESEIGARDTAAGREAIL